MATQNSLGINETGLVVYDGAGDFTGVSIVAGSGISVTNGDGTSGTTITVSGDGSLANSFPTDSGTATPASGVLTIAGNGEDTSTSGSGPTVTVSPTTNYLTTSKHAWNGAILETTSSTVTSDGVTITFAIEKSGTGDLTVVFSDGFYDWDTSPADTVSLTEGSDTVPQINYVYFLQSTKALTASTTGWPSGEHAPIATVLCQSAASLQTDGAYKVHAWTDHVVGTNNEGHISEQNFWIRQQPATWVSGVGQTFTITPNGGAADNVILTTSAGFVLQLQPHTFPAFGGTPDVYVVNDFTTPYTKVTDLNALLTDSTGASMSGKYFSLVIWGCVSDQEGDCKLYCNLPGGSYNSQSNLEQDVDEFSNYTIPSDFTGTGFLIAEWKLRHQAASSGTWTSIEEIDLRGLSPSLTAGGGVGSVTEFADTAFRVFDDADDSKKLAFEASGITASTTRTLTAPNADGTLMISSAGDSGTATPSATGAMTFAGTGAATTSAATNTVTINAVNCAEFIVDATGAEGTHTTIASAITDASSGDTIFIRPGTYTENLTLKAGVDLVSFSGQGANSRVVISGKCTLTSGRVTIAGVRLQTNSDFCISVTGSSSAILRLKDCVIDADDNTAIQFTNSNGSSEITIWHCVGLINTTGVALFSHSGSGPLRWENSIVYNNSGSTTASTISSGSVRVRNCYFSTPITSSSTGAVTLQNSSYDLSGTTALTAGGTANLIDGCTLNTGSAVPVSISSSCRITNSTFSHSNADLVSGAGESLITNLSSTSEAELSTTTNTARWMHTGITRSVVQPAFLAYLGSTVNNVTGNGTQFTLGTTTALTEVFDQNGDFVTSGTFTAPVTGRYILGMTGLATGLSAATRLDLIINTSNREFWHVQERASGSSQFGGTQSVIADMDEGDTATFEIEVTGEAGDTADIFGTTNMFNGVWGYLVC